jgi:phosphatidylinositol 4-kinase type 2
MQDADFQEKMYARQIAVMKGQAWNVVETLKTPDHGPLELTRRARVCVWDDLVDVPVAVPLRAPAESTRQKERRSREEHEEMDISAARASTPQPQPQPDLLGSPKPDFTPHGPFNTSRQSSQMDVRASMESTGGPLSPDSLKGMADIPSQNGGPSRGYFPPRSINRARMSYEGPRRAREGASSWHARRFSLSARSMGNPFNEEDEADLGYAANEDRESSQKKVIVERLEPVKSKKPFFTWC